MARITRKELKSDKFATEVSHTVEFVAVHRRQLVRVAIAAAVVVVIVFAALAYMRNQRAAREELLAAAIRIQDTLVGSAGADVPTYPTQEAKNKEVNRAFNAVIDKYPTSDEAQVARYYLGANAADTGKLADAQKYFDAAINGGNQQYGSLAKVALAQVYFDEGRSADGEKLLRDLMEHPTLFVSKDEAAIVLARELEHSRPLEARKLLEPLRTGRTTISQIAIGMLGQMNQGQ